MGPLAQMFQQMPQRQLQSAPVRQPMGFAMPQRPVGMYDTSITPRAQIGPAPLPGTPPPQPGGLAAMLANSRRPVLTRARPVDPVMPMTGMGGVMPFAGVR